MPSDRLTPSGAALEPALGQLGERASRSGSPPCGSHRVGGGPAPGIRQPRSFQPAFRAAYGPSLREWRHMRAARGEAGQAA
ncbi:hypothetical protein GCM10010377_32710 [Streptomyces viridiviolaceus]|nr:hypothetical protein GCM10010377_32710 [Streptomyces viridiviolaceus]